MGYPSIIIRTLDNYIPSTDEEKPCLLPYSQTLFNYEHPHYICELIKKLSSLRLYLYGNDEFISSEWSNLMISRETHVMEDEDSWCAFIENECIDDEIKWNFGSLFGGKWQIKRLAPINLTELNKNLRFQSALHRADKTFTHRQYQITAEIFEWYDRCIHEGYFQLEVNENFSFISIDYLIFVLNSLNYLFNKRIKLETRKPHHFWLYRNVLFNILRLFIIIKLRNLKAYHSFGLMKLSIHRIIILIK